MASLGINHVTTKPWVCRQGPATRGLSAPARLSLPTLSGRWPSCPLLLADFRRGKCLGARWQQVVIIQHCDLVFRARVTTCQTTFSLSINTYERRQGCKPSATTSPGKDGGTAVCAVYAGVLQYVWVAICGIQRLIIWKINVMPWKGKKREVFLSLFLSFPFICLHNLIAKSVF